MPKGVLKRGTKRKNHSRWSKALLEPLYRSWLAGEDLRNISQHHSTTFGRLRSAFIYFGFDTSNLLKRGAQSMLVHGREQAVEAWKPSKDFDPASHRASRHYQGSFEL